MNATADVAWSEANQKCLVDELSRVLAILERCVREKAKTEKESRVSPEEVQELRSAGRGRAWASMALEFIVARFGLTAFERDVLLLCAGMELDSRFPAACAQFHGDGRHAHPSFGLALAAFPQAHWSALSPNAPLRSWRLIEILSGDSLVSSPLRIDEQILHFLTGVKSVDERLRGIADPLSADQELPPSFFKVAEEIARLWHDAQTRGQPPVITLCGPDAGVRLSIAERACSLASVHPWVMAESALPQSPVELDALQRIWEREALLTDAVLVVDCDVERGEQTGHEAAITRFIDKLWVPLMVSSRNPRPARLRAVVTLEVPRLSHAEKALVWQAALGDDVANLNGQIGELSQQFQLHPRAIGAAVAEARSDAQQFDDRLWHACKTHARPRLDQLAQRIGTTVNWEQLVLTPPQKETLRDITVHVRQRAKVYEHWGFSGKGARGLGMAALFTGPSGTGKTMAAEVLATELRLDLYRIDLSQVVSKYIGETEKHLRQIFDGAETGGCILLFDEADALFGKRSEVKDSHDRYANIEVSYLLQKMEEFRGLAILTTNQKSALDPAFLRRLRFVVSFPFPDSRERTEIWRRVFPKSTPTSGLNFELLGRLNVAGGTIRNIAIGAAFLAADRKEPVSMDLLVQAAQREYAKLERTLTRAEIEGWE